MQIRAQCPRLAHPGTQKVLVSRTASIVILGIMLCGVIPAELLLISRFGWVMAAVLGVAWLSSVVVLPALLAGTLGRLIEDVEFRSRTPKTTGELRTVKTLPTQTKTPGTEDCVGRVLFL